MKFLLKVNFKTVLLTLNMLFFHSVVYASDGPIDLLYRFEKDGKKLYVLGVSHIGRFSDFPINENILKAFRGSNMFINESALLFQTQEEVSLNLKKQYLTNGSRSLEQVFSDKECKSKLENYNFGEKIIRLINEINPRLSLKNFEMLSPKALIHQIYFGNSKTTPAANMKNDVSPVNLEYALWEIAKKTNKEISSLDPEFWESIDLLSDEEVCDFVIGITEIRSDTAFLTKNLLLVNNLFRSIDANNASLVRSHYFELSDASQLPYRELHRKWFDLRNMICSKKIIELSELSNGPVFVAIGAAHLSGENGVIARLEKSGFQLNLSK
ncbi:TraB/GumN family protein [Undibacterium sp.]|uniref:TraB/GumN family protein n=1 Tax=Undibacterium sp. TaxID=1914977 RepID=UPI0037506BC1